MTSLKDTANLQTLGLTLEQYAAAKMLPLEFLRSLGLRNSRYRGAAAVRIPYTDQLGRETCVRIRMAMAGQRFSWRIGSKPSAYGHDRLERARQLGHITLVEGESDAQTLWHHDQPALGLPGAASWQDFWAAYLTNIETIYVVIEPDQGGSALMARLGRSPLRDRIYCMQLGGHKDASDLHRSSPDGFLIAWEAAKQQATSLTEVQQEQEQVRAKEDERLCCELSRSPDILALAADSTAKAGFVGEARSLKVLYLAITSRLLPRPVSVAVKGPSSAGKSAVVEQALRFFPSEAFYTLSSMTERALIYSEESLVHRMLVIYEASGMKGELASYLIRSLLSEGRRSHRSARNDHRP